MYYCSEACGIETAGEFVITGGRPWRRLALKTVTRYSRRGMYQVTTETLPDLIVGRFRHACGSFITEEGENVRFS